MFYKHPASKSGQGELRLHKVSKINYFILQCKEDHYMNWFWSTLFSGRTLDPGYMASVRVRAQQISTGTKIKVCSRNKVAQKISAASREKALLLLKYDSFSDIYFVYKLLSVWQCRCWKKAWTAFGFSSLRQNPEAKSATIFQRAFTASKAASKTASRILAKDDIRLQKCPRTKQWKN